MTKSQRRKGNAGIPGMKSMRCPYCGSTVRLRSADGIYRDNSSGTQLYVCSKYPACDAYVRVHPGTTTPVGSLADGKLRALRRTAHRHFDRLHESGLMSKDSAYQWLAHTLQRPLSQAHIGYLSEYYCAVVVSESDKFFNTWKHKVSYGNRRIPASGGVSYAAQ